MIRSRKTILFLLIPVAAAIWLAGTVGAVLLGEGSAGLITPVSSPTPSPTPEESWLILPPMPAGATQADIGAEIYALVCRDCHGDRGQGLTDEFRATWAPQDQNCWQSKCHAPNHPPEGFDLPRFVPAIIGPNTLTRFESAADLLAFIGANMPWHNPGSLINEEYWQLTAYILRENEAHTTLRFDNAASSQP